MERGVLRALNRPVRCMADVEDSLSMEPFIMQRLIIISHPLSLSLLFALTCRFPKCQEEWSETAKPKPLLSQADDSPEISTGSRPIRE